jgi:hypothetical protein
MRLWLGRGARNRGELVGLEFIAGFEMECDSRRFRLEPVRVNAMDDGYKRLCVARILDRKALGTQEEDDTRPGRALRQLSVQHFVDLPKMRVGRVSAGLATGECQQEQNRKH